MLLTPGQAAKAAGVDRTTIARAIKAGRLSATRREDGARLIDPAELARVYGVQVSNGAAGAPVGAHEALPQPARGQGEASQDARLAAAEAEIKALLELVSRLDRDKQDLAQQRDGWQAQAERLALAAPTRPRQSWWRWR